jgi:hypothetical protein
MPANYLQEFCVGRPIMAFAALAPSGRGEILDTPLGDSGWIGLPPACPPDKIVQPDNPNIVVIKSTDRVGAAYFARRILRNSASRMSRNIPGVITAMRDEVPDSTPISLLTGRPARLVEIHEGWSQRMGIGGLLGLPRARVRRENSSAAARTYLLPQKVFPWLWVAEHPKVQVLASGRRSLRRWSGHVGVFRFGNVQRPLAHLFDSAITSVVAHRTWTPCRMPCSSKQPILAGACAAQQRLEPRHVFDRPGAASAGGRGSARWIPSGSTPASAG